MGWWPMAAAAAAAAAVVVVRIRFGKLCMMKGPSMLPTIQADGDFGLLNHHCTASRGDIVVFRSPIDIQRRMCKRLIALPGDWIKMPEKREIRQVPGGHCWVEGDNAGESEDSRHYGLVPLGLMEGRITHIISPPSRIRRVDRMVPQGRVMPRHFFYKPRH